MIYVGETSCLEKKFLENLVSSKKNANFASLLGQRAASKARTGRGDIPDRKYTL